MIEIREPMQIVQIPGNRRMLAVDLERIQSLVAARVAGRFERRQRAVMEPGQECAGVVDMNVLDLAGEGMLATLHKSLGRPRDTVDRTVEP